MRKVWLGLTFFLGASLPGAGYPYSRFSGEAVTVAIYTFCLKKYSSRERHYVYSRSLLEVLPKYVRQLEAPAQDEYMQLTLVSHLRQFESWSEEYSGKLCDGAFEQGLPDFSLPSDSEKNKGR